MSEREIEDGPPGKFSGSRNCTLMFEERLAKLSTELDASSLTVAPSYATLCSIRVDAVIGATAIMRRIADVDSLYASSTALYHRRRNLDILR
jgi:hypothetical protein